MLLSEVDLVLWGERIGETMTPPLFLALEGPLGAGKSVLARAVARGAGVEGAMPSPTFNLLFRYPARRGEVAHLDLYRIRDPEELRELGWDELGSASELVIVEWPERAGSLLPDRRWHINLRIPPDRPSFREVSVTRIGDPPDLPGFHLHVLRSDGGRPG